ncbi:MAG: glycosyltransferase family 9 protein [Candidatus Firestonebacteria bacterium]
MNKTRMFFHNLENTFKGLLIKILFKGSKNIPPDKIDFAGIKKILIVRQHDPMGDVLISTAIIPNLKNAFPDAELDVVARPQLSEKDIFVNSPIIKEVIIFSKKEFFYPLKMLFFVKQLKSKKYDIAIVAGSTSVSFTSLLLAYLSGAGIRVGYDGEYFGKKLYTDAFLTTPVPYDASIIKHQVIRNLDILSYFNIPITSKEHYMFINEKEKEAAGERMKQNGIIKPEVKVVGMHLGANVLMNRWPVERFAEISDSLSENQKVKVVVFYGPKEKNLAEDFKKTAKNTVFIQDALPLRQFAAMLSLLDVFICNDTGVLHVAAAVGTKTIAIFGPTDPNQWNPLGENHLWIRNEDHSVFSVKPEEVIKKVNEFLRR